MDRSEALRIIDATLKRAGFVEVGPGVADYEGAIPVHGRKVDVSVSIPDVRFAVRPRIRLKDKRQLPIEILAHVEEEEGICYASGAGLPVDLYKPGEAILRMLAEASRTLELSFRGRGKTELIDEYQHYWFPKLTVRCFLPRMSDRAETKAGTFFATRNGESEFIALAVSTDLPGYGFKFPQLAYVWHVQDRVGPGGGVGKPSTLEELERWFATQPALQGRSWPAVVDHLARGEMFFIAAPNAFLGLKLTMPSDLSAGLARRAIRQEALPKLLLARKGMVEIERLSGSRCDIDQVTARNNADMKNLADISIALVGCGTIGGHLARMLVQCGAGSHALFTVFDTQDLREGNIGRHLLGFGDVGKMKASALKEELERFHPQVRIEASTDDALKQWTRLAKHDLVIDATGDWNVQSTLNEQFLARTDVNPKALLHSYVFMNGAGVQSFLNLDDEHGCFRCLKPKFDGPWRYPVADERAELNLQPASCGDGSFIPFTVEASTMAASLANRAALDWANGKPGPRLRSAVVDLTRGRYQKPVSPPPSSQCPACAHRRMPK
jgi:molybdopterin/thiamine biosynthesis adenylyltransferase